MLLYEAFSHSNRFHYRAHICSLATCFLIICTILTFLPPFLFAYYAGGFWIKEGLYTEQPRINYSAKYILIADNSDTALNRFFSSSYSSLNTVFREVVLSGTNTFTAKDTNADGVTDQLSVVLQIFFGTTTANLQNLNVWLMFQYELRGRQYVDMETMVLVNLLPPNNIALANNPNVTVVGDLILDQRRPFQSSGYDTTYNSSIINLDTLLTQSSLDLNPVLDQYFTRSYYTSFQQQFVRWKPGAISGSNILTVNITLNIKPQRIRFIPGFWQEFKWGWIQYVCVLLPFVAGFNHIKELVFKKQLVRTLVEFPYHRHKA